MGSSVVSKLTGKLSKVQLRGIVRADDASALGEHLRAQTLARESVLEISKLLKEGWTELQAAQLIDTYLQDSGVRSFFHKAYVWFGDRTRFEGIKRYSDYMPTGRRLTPNTAYILDVAPILNGRVADIGFSGSFGENDLVVQCKAELKALRDFIPKLFESSARGDEIWHSVDSHLQAAGFDNIHKKYPFSVLGHPVYNVPSVGKFANILHFGWQSYWSLVSHGLFSQLLNPNLQVRPEGLWAIEPHIGLAQMGAKFEEILVVEKTRAYWLGEPFGV